MCGMTSWKNGKPYHTWTKWLLYELYVGLPCDCGKTRIPEDHDVPQP